VASGTSCQPRCAVTGTVSVATCTDSVWSVTGSCGTTPPPGTTTCDVLPAFPDAQPGACEVPAQPGYHCRPICDPSFKGNLEATCGNDGTWTQISSCEVVSGSEQQFSVEVSATVGTDCASVER
jgi:hypothetical protein